MYLISPDKKQYKANLHSHSTLSDGARTPEQLKERYKNRGYSVLAITDHEVPHNHSNLTDDEFLMITGYEVYIRPQPKFDMFVSEAHLNLFAKKPDNIKYVGYDKPYCKYLSADEAEALEKVGPEGPRKVTKEYINSFIKVANENGYLVSYNHPHWSKQSEAEILSYEGFFSLEVFNHNSNVMTGLENGCSLYDKIISSGRMINCHGADDNHNSFEDGHPLSDSYGAFTMIMADSLDYDSVISAMENGDMYASMGPEFKEISFDGKTLHIECSPVKHICVFFGCKYNRFNRAKDGEYLTSFDVNDINENAKYIRVALTDEKGNFATTRAYTKEETGLGK